MRRGPFERQTSKRRQSPARSPVRLGIESPAKNRADLLVWRQYSRRSMCTGIDRRGRLLNRFHDDQRREIG